MKSNNEFKKMIDAITKNIHSGVVSINQGTKINNEGNNTEYNNIELTDEKIIVIYINSNKDTMDAIDGLIKSKINKR